MKDNCKRLFIIMCGIPGSGKTTIAQDLQARFSYTICQPFERNFTEMFPMKKHVSEDYLWFDHGYRIAEKSPVIFDATFHIYEKRNHIYMYVHERGIKLLLINVEADEVTVNSRLEEQRKNKSKKINCEVKELVKLYASTYQSPINDQEHKTIININTVSNKIVIYNDSDNIEINRIKEYLKTKNIEKMDIDLTIAST
jgi:hypothetical protein